MIHVNKIITISLKENIHRQKMTKDELQKIHLTTDFYLTERDKGFEERGCFLSHVNVAKKALAENCETVLVFEDDVKIILPNTSQCQAINHFIQSQQQFDLLYLGLILGKMWFCGHRSIVRAKGAGAHAYILSKQGMQKMAAYQYKGIPIDRLIKRELKCYSVYPMIAEQYPETMVMSDITPSRMGEIKDPLFWERNYQKQQGILWRNWRNVFWPW